MTDYYKHKELGICTKCSEPQFKNTILCKKCWLSRVFNNMIWRVKGQNNKKNHSYQDKKVCMTRVDFINWGMLQNIDNLKQPSIDRIDSDKDYSFDNIRFIEIVNNKRRSVFTQTDGICYKCKKKLPIENFVKSKCTTNGRTSICRPCESKRKKNK